MSMPITPTRPNPKKTPANPQLASAKPMQPGPTIPATVLQTEAIDTARARSRVGKISGKYR